jgi:hypothetical protein
LSKALTVNIWLSRTPPPLAEPSSALAAIAVHSWGIPVGLPSPLPLLPLTLELESQYWNALQVNTKSPPDILWPPQLALRCTNRGALLIRYWVHPVGTVWAPSNVNSHMGVDLSNELPAINIHVKSGGLQRDVQVPLLALCILTILPTYNTLLHCNYCYPRQKPLY